MAQPPCRPSASAWPTSLCFWRRPNVARIPMPDPSCSILIEEILSQHDLFDYQTDLHRDNLAGRVNQSICCRTRPRGEATHLGDGSVSGPPPRELALRFLPMRQETPRPSLRQTGALPALTAGAMMPCSSTGEPLRTTDVSRSHLQSVIAHSGAVLSLDSNSDGRQNHSGPHLPKADRGRLQPSIPDARSPAAVVLLSGCRPRSPSVRELVPSTP